MGIIYQYVCIYIPNYTMMNHVQIIYIHTYIMYVCMYMINT